jgi:hypothetical protein
MLEVLYDLMRLFFAVAGAIIGWFITPPIVRLLGRLAFHKPPAPILVRVTRVLGAILVGVLVFQFFPFGSGGGGGGGSGGGTGAGVGNKKGNGSSQAAAGKKTEAAKKVEGPAPAGKEVLAIELIASKLYEKDSGRYYLLKGQEPPRDLDEIKQYLKANKDRLRLVNILLYADSVYEEHPAVTDLKEAIEALGLPWSRPPEYLKKHKLEAPSK